jgi:hypothetical protein
MKRLLLLAGIVLASLSAPTHAQVSVNYALAVFGQGSPWEGFFGPFRATETGTQYLFTVLCVDVSKAPRAKFPMEVVASVPDTATALEFVQLATSAVVNGCAQYHVTVARGAVVLPQMQVGR